MRPINILTILPYLLSVVLVKSIPLEYVPKWSTSTEISTGSILHRVDSPRLGLERRVLSQKVKVALAVYIKNKGSDGDVHSEHWQLFACTAEPLPLSPAEQTKYRIPKTSHITIHGVATAVPDTIPRVPDPSLSLKGRLAKHEHPSSIQLDFEIAVAELSMSQYIDWLTGINGFRLRSLPKEQGGNCLDFLSVALDMLVKKHVLSNERYIAFEAFKEQHYRDVMARTWDKVKIRIPESVSL